MREKRPKFFVAENVKGILTLGKGAVFEKIKSDEQISADLKIHELIEQNAATAQYVAFDVPWNLPNCLSCKKKCPGFENCHEPHIEWMWHHHNEKLKKKRPKKLFTPCACNAAIDVKVADLQLMLHAFNVGLLLKKFACLSIEPGVSNAQSSSARLVWT